MWRPLPDMKVPRSIGMDAIFQKTEMTNIKILWITLAILWKILKNGIVKCLILKQKQEILQKLGTNKFVKIFMTSLFLVKLESAGTSALSTIVHLRYLHHSWIRGVLIQSCSAGAKNFTNYVFCHPQFSGVIQNNENCCAILTPICLCQLLSK